MKVYIAGPYTKGDVALNIRRMIEVAECVVAAGHTPFIPLLYHFWHLMSPHEYDYWMALDHAWIEACEILIWLDGESTGTQEDVGIAEHLGLAVYSVDEFFEWIVSKTLDK